MTDYREYKSGSIVKRHWKWGERTQTSTEAQRKEHDRAFSIDRQLKDARSKIDWTRRREAESDIVKWFKVYICKGLLLDEEPPPLGEQIIREMWQAIFDARPYLICQARGSGKTSYIEGVTLAAIAQGKRDFFVLIGQSADSAKNMLYDIYRVVNEDSPFSQDYPDLCLPFYLVNGSLRRRQTYNGVSTDIQKTVDRLIFARLKEEDGTEALTSSSCIVVKGITGGLRGLKHGTKRPSCIVLDDIQDDETANSATSVEKLMSIINKGVLNLGGKGKVAVLQAATPIASEDIVDRIRHDKAWKTTVFPAIIKWPLDILKHPTDGHWKKYFDLYDEENSMDLKHEKSLKYYKRHRKAMDKGAVVLNPNRFKESDGHISALQALLEKKHDIGDSAFFCEYQMEPKRVDTLLEITPKKIIEKIDPNVKINTPPDGYIHTYASVDLNTSFGATCAVASFKTDGSCAVIKEAIYKVNIDQKLPDIQYDQELYQKLDEIVKRLKDTGIDIRGIGIDAGGRNFSAVCQFAKNCNSLCGIPACAMLGKAGHQFNPLLRSRLRNAVGRTVLCGDEKEQVKRGSGYKWLNFDSDFFREAVHRSLLMPLGSPGGTVLFSALPMVHLEFATQICNEQLKWKKTLSDGRTECHWKSKDPHDFLDDMSMLFAIAKSEGVSSENSITKHSLETINSERQRNIRKLQMLKRKRITLT